MSRYNHVSIAKLKNANISPRKLNLLAKSIRGLEVDKAQAFLINLNKKSSSILLKCIKSAVANALNKEEENIVDSLYLSRIIVTKGMTHKRVRPRAMGRGSIIKKKFSNLTVVLDKII